ncbi:MAG: 1-phosphofructokinase [Erysipelotrichaceae bacterium]|nr:1-phosphofructokinase [Erysipelotrichaceae bacterium]
MIYTCTLNPSLDYYMSFDNIENGRLNRSISEHFEAGGKGINVSIVLNNLRIPSRALGFVGGFTKDFFMEHLMRYTYIEPNFTYIKGHTRINVKAFTGVETTLNAKGPQVSEEEKRMMLRRVDRLTNYDLLVLSGSCPDNCFDMAEKMMQHCVENEVKIVLDTKPSTMLAFLKYRPLLVKPNLEELEDMFEEPIFTEKDIVKHARRLVEMGAENCIVSLGADGAILVNETGAYKSNVVPGEVRNTIGAGDSVVAGFLMSYLRSTDIIQIFQYASACGSATALSDTLATREEVEAIVDQIVITKIEEDNE